MDRDAGNAALTMDRTQRALAILRLLDAHPDGLTCRECAEALGHNYDATRRVLLYLRSLGEVEHWETVSLPGGRTGAPPKLWTLPE